MPGKLEGTKAICRRRLKNLIGSTLYPTSYIYRLFSTLAGWALETSTGTELHTGDACGLLELP